MRLGRVQPAGGRGAVLGWCHLRCKNRRRAGLKPKPGAELLAPADDPADDPADACAYASVHVSAYASFCASEQASQRLRTPRFLRETGVNSSRPQNPSDESP